MSGAYDAIVIGAGHNGLTTAALLAKAGRKVLVLERREHPGGLAASEEFHPGYRSAGLLGDTSLLRPSVVAALDLLRHGLRLREVPPTVLACAPDDWHEVSLLMLGVLLRRQGWPVSYLGPAVPLPDLASFVRAARPAAVVLVAMLPESARALQAWPEHLPELAERGRPPVCFAGRGFTAEPALLESMPGHYLGSSLESGVARLLEILGESTGRRSD